MLSPIKIQIRIKIHTREFVNFINFDIKIVFINFDKNNLFAYLFSYKYSH